MTDQQVIDSRDDLEMMLRPHLWPRGFYLPLKRARHGEGYHHDFALLWCDAARNHRKWLFTPESEQAENVFNPDFSEQIELTEDGVRQLPTQGWVVD